MRKTLGKRPTTFGLSVGNSWTARATAIAAAICCAPAYAQTAAPKPEALQRVEVTGSNIKRLDVEMPRESFGPVEP